MFFIFLLKLRYFLSKYVIIKVMIYYIDFDSTLYKTSMLKQNTLHTMATTCCALNPALNYNDVLNEATYQYQRGRIYHAFKLCHHLAQKYGVSEETLKHNVSSVINNGSIFVYDDAIDFLKRLKAAGNEVHMLTFVTIDGISYQSTKINGSGLKKYFDDIHIATCPKWEINIDYSNGVFIDDNPSDLVGLYQQHPVDVIRIRRDDNKYSLIDIEEIPMKEFPDLKSLADYLKI